jgi:hypothetical protein
MGRPAYAGSLDSKSHQNGSIFPNKLTYATVSFCFTPLKPFPVQGDDGFKAAILSIEILLNKNIPAFKLKINVHRSGRGGTVR